jgi:hypothetical protein
MAWDDYYFEYEQEAAMEKFLEEELRRIAEEPVFSYLACYGDAIEARVRRCLDQARNLIEAGFPGAALVRAAAGIEVQGAFLSDDWSRLISEKVLNGRTAEDRELLPAILRNWKIDITSVKLPDGSQVWEQIVGRVWPGRNGYVHKADDASRDEAILAIDCLEALLLQVVDPLARKLGFTRDKTGSWAVVTVENPPDIPNLNPPRRLTPKDPILK